MNTSSLLNTLAAPLTQAQAPVRQGPVVDDGFSRALDRKRDDDRLAASREANRQTQREPAPQISEEAKALERRELNAKNQPQPEARKTAAAPVRRPEVPPVEPTPGTPDDPKTGSGMSIAKMRALHAGNGGPGINGNTGPAAPQLPPKLTPIFEAEMTAPSPANGHSDETAEPAELDVGAATVICLAPADPAAVPPVTSGTLRQPRLPVTDANSTTEPVAPSDEGAPIREGTPKQPIRVGPDLAATAGPAASLGEADQTQKRAADTAGAPIAGVPITGVPQAAAPGATHASAATAPTAEAQLQARPGSPTFAAELGAQVTLWVRDGVHQAKLQLNPADMGPVVVQIQIDGNQAQVRLAAEQADTRQALEQALPFLAGSLSESGLTLAGGGVFEQAAQRDPDSARDTRDASPRDRRAGADADTDAASARRLSTPMRSRGVVDLIA